ncbi:hypothetical protein SCLCIDRAFT_806660 [Scleroderma citrinum Foug A]|uniref:Uncharacterized protein n=1 Tax=Scleroderma citrinum Foug A TaxID=1036808 RepID=A0A0C3DPJ2_9AGAM|nr:hypothetical protein SCLCIDRAFT_806660 [Scleroderma citrinum Foug A]
MLLRGSLALTHLRSFYLSMSVVFITIFMDTIHDTRRLGSISCPASVMEPFWILSTLLMFGLTCRYEAGGRALVYRTSPALLWVGATCWPTLKTLSCLCSTAFATALSKVTRTVLGHHIATHNFGYGCIEGLRGSALNIGDSEEFYFRNWIHR